MIKGMGMGCRCGPTEISTMGSGSKIRERGMGWRRKEIPLGMMVNGEMI